MANTSKKILLVEDDAFLAMLIQSKLQKDGFEVLISNDGPSVLPTIKKEKPALLLLDIILPGKTGFEVLEEMSAAKIKIPFIVVSNLGQKEDLDRAEKLGTLAYFVKSRMTLEALSSKINSFFG
jgi:DNA-binding response OmpR family regulator